MDAMPAIETPLPYAHWMLREIYQQPETLRKTLDRYVLNGAFREEVCAPLRAWLAAAPGEIVIAASGSSRHAGMVGELLLEEISGFAVDVEYASEFCYRSDRSMKNASVLVISQSGETADTLAALRKSAAAGHSTMAITNLADSTMALEATVSFPTEAGRERAIPATKSFTAQLLNIYLLALLAAEERNMMGTTAVRASLTALTALPTLMEAQLEGWERKVRALSERYTAASSFLFLGRGVHYPIAKEGALKLKESAYLHAEGYPSGELKHGPNALVSASLPLVMLATVDHSDQESIERYERVIHLMADMRKQGATIIAISNAGDATIAGLATDVITVEETREALVPICEVVPLQMLAYCMAVLHGIDVDHPRNLVKAVVRE
jgi:glucosamine--fructose-6-phosphate aminotransferase (isomerizing)